MDLVQKLEKKYHFQNLVFTVMNGYIFYLEMGFKLDIYRGSIKLRISNVSSFEYVSLIHNRNFQYLKSKRSKRHSANM